MLDSSSYLSAKPKSTRTGIFLGERRIFAGLRVASLNMEE